ncbi:protocatechuate 3,4-dioxygenase subunit beta, partial [Streptomyces sp. TRM76130]|nr:protocatechuate 3,4-dioxygenase subunit beta [Streptomyces sp. TRM76130]
MTLTQHDIDAEMAAERAAYEKRRADGAPVEHHPRRDYAPYRSSLLRHPKQPPIAIDATKDPELVELSSPAFGERDLTAIDNDLTVQHPGEPVGERITVSGRLLDRDGRPVRGQLVEIWQANSAGRYAHQREQHDAPLDPNFTGTGRTITDDDGRYR